MARKEFVPCITLDCGAISETTDPSATISNWLESATATDNCDTDPELTYNFDATTLDVCVGGTLTVTWTSTDACGNVGTATSTITVVPDTEDPIVTAPAGITLDCGDISETTDPCATISNWLESASATDNCDTDPEVVNRATLSDNCEARKRNAIDTINATRPDIVVIANLYRLGKNVDDDQFTTGEWTWRVPGE